MRKFIPPFWEKKMARLSFHRAIIMIFLNRDETGLLPFLSVNAADKNQQKILKLQNVISKLFSKYSTIPSFSLKTSFLIAVAVTFLHAKILFFQFRSEGLCLQALCVRVNIYFGLLCRDDAIMWRKIIPVRRNS